MNDKKPKARKTVVGDIDPAVLEYTAGKDYKLDLALVEADCIGTAAHVKMLAGLPIDPPLFNAEEVAAVIRRLSRIMEDSRKGEFSITVEDQDVHLAVERTLTAALGDLGKRVHTARSRNDQVAVDIRIYARTQLLDSISEAAALARSLLEFARKHKNLPMVGRTHMQPAMPSSVGLWASAFSESLLDDIALMRGALDLANCCPLGSAASYGVPLPLDRQMVSDLLGFERPCRNVLYAANTRGRLESVILSAMSQAMLTLSRLAEDLIIFSMPEFGYFRLPAEYCTGSSIMPQKNNPDVLELIRARTARVKSFADSVFAIVQSSPSGYNRDLQEAKEPFMEGLKTVRQTLRILPGLLEGVEVVPDALLAGFTPDVFATDQALELVGQGMPFRDAYYQVKNNLAELKECDPGQAIARKNHLGATGAIDFEYLDKRIDAQLEFAVEENRAFTEKIVELMAGADAAG